MTKDKFPKSLKVFEMMPELEQKRWYTANQVVLAYPIVFHTKEDFLVMEKDNKLQKKDVLRYTDDYSSYLRKGEKTGFYDIKYRVVRVYDFNYIKKNLKNKYKPKYIDYAKNKFFIEENKADDLRQYLSRRSYINGGKYGDKEELVKVDFYGKKVLGIRKYINEDITRIFYGMFMMQSSIRSHFIRKYKIQNRILDLILFVYPFQFFTKTDIAAFHKATHNQSRTIQYIINELTREKLIEPVEIKKTSMHKLAKTKYYKEGRTHWQYKCTDKLNKLAKDYIDYVMLNKRFKFDGESISDIENTFLNKKFQLNRRLHTKDNSFKVRRRTIPHSLYDEVYQYVNNKYMIDYMEEDAYQDCMRAGNVFKFNPFLWEITKTNYLKSQGKESSSLYNKRYLTRHSFGLDID